MDEKELNELVNKKLRTIDSEEYMIKTCSFDDGECDYGDCSICNRGRAAIREEILDEEETEAKKNDPAHLLKFKVHTHQKTGLKYWRNDYNTIAEAPNTETILSVIGLPSEGLRSINDGPELDKPYPLWAKIRDHVNKETPVQELLFQDNKLPLFIQCLPLFIQCEGRVLAIAPCIK